MRNTLQESTAVRNVFGTASRCSLQCPRLIPVLSSQSLDTLGPTRPEGKSFALSDKRRPGAHHSGKTFLSAANAAARRQADRPALQQMYAIPSFDKGTCVILKQATATNAAARTNIPKPTLHGRVQPVEPQNHVTTGPLSNCDIKQSDHFGDE